MIKSFLNQLYLKALCYWRFEVFFSPKIYQIISIFKLILDLNHRKFKGLELLFTHQSNLTHKIYLIISWIKLAVYLILIVYGNLQIFIQFKHSHAQLEKLKESHMKTWIFFEYY